MRILACMSMEESPHGIVVAVGEGKMQIRVVKVVDNCKGAIGLWRTEVDTKTVIP